MSLAETSKMTTADLLAIPDDGVERWLIDGELRKGGMTRRNRKHARVEAEIAQLLCNWEDASDSADRTLSGEVGCILRNEPDTTVGIDVAFFSAETMARQTDETTIIDGAPVLAVEILSPSDQHDAITEKVNSYLDHGVAVWKVDPDFQTITVYEADNEPRSFNRTQEITAEPYLPGFTVSVAHIFQ